MFKTRLISGIVLIVIALFVLWIGGAVTGAVTVSDEVDVDCTVLSLVVDCTVLSLVVDCTVLSLVVDSAVVSASVVSGAFPFTLIYPL